MPLKHNDLKTIEDAVRYLGSCLGRKGEWDNEKVAFAISDIGVSDNHQEWYKSDPDYAAISDLAWDLEWSNTGWPEQDWAELEGHYAKLKKKYLEPDTKRN